jgi:catechol 2,3-dioxygenase-like lactoylglutathione lyase family enzyme
MVEAMLEHVNVSVKNPEETARLMERLFGWKVRWHGRSSLGGESWHVGEDKTYVAFCEINKPPEGAKKSRPDTGSLNHIGILVDDLGLAEERITAAGFNPFNHASYKPGRRFYFYTNDNIEFEVISYN